MSSRSATLLGLGVLMLAIAALAGLGRTSAAGPATTPVLAAAPTRPPVVQNRDAVRQAANLSDAFVTIAEAVTPAVVRISAEQLASPEPPEWLSRRLQEIFGSSADSSMAPADPLPPAIAGGTGFLVSSDGYVLTNDHVIADAGRITVILADKRSYVARVIGRDPTTDVAVVKIDAKDLPALALGDSDQARVGEWVIAVGNPGFDDSSTLDFTVTGGIISAKGRPLNLIPQGLAQTDPVAGSYAIEDFIQTDAVINPGNSGGPLLNLRGEVIGVNTAIASTTGFSQGYAFAIPSNLAARVMRDLITVGHVRRPLLGVQIADVTPEDADAYGLASIAGVRVDDFGEASPAQHAGIERHDVIVALDGQPVERVGQLQRLVALRAPGDTVTVSLVRWGTALEVDVPLDQAPIAEPHPQAETPTQEPRQATGIGLEIGDLDAATAGQLGYIQPGGAYVARVVPFGVADRKGVTAGDRIVAIGRDEIRTAREARSIVRATGRGEVLSLLLETAGGRTYIANLRVP